MVTYFVVQGFVRGPRGHILPDEPRQVKTEEQARMAAQRFAESHAGAIAFSRSGDPDMGDWEDAVIIGVYGDVPKEASEAYEAA